MTSRRSLLAVIGASGAAGWVWLSREPWPYAGCACVIGGPDQRRFLPVESHCHAEGIDRPALAGWDP
jgi:hypothetical protein